MAALRCGSAFGARLSARPNILFIMTDQQSASMMSCTGNPWLRTPAMDRLAASGTRFERAYAANPVCLPNRFSLQTGLMPSTIGVRQNTDSASATVSDVMVQQSLGRLLQQAGYETAYGGKVHLPKKMSVEDIGYRYLTRDEREPLAEACAEFIKGPHQKPFFLFASFINPHDICQLALNAYARSLGQTGKTKGAAQSCEELLDQARNSGDVGGFVKSHCPPLPANFEVPVEEPECITTHYLQAREFRNYVRRNWSDDEWRLHRWVFCRLTERVDGEIGQLLDALKEAGLEDNTLVVFTSDHGDMDAAHRMEHKSVLYEEAIRIPFMMSHPGKIPAGRVDETHLVSNGLDLLPTLCAYAGVTVPAGRFGLDLRPVAEQRSAAWRDSLVVESQNGRMVCTDRFKYCLYDDGKNREQFIDRQTDPGEMINLAGRPEYAAELNRHRRLLREWIGKTGDPIGAQYVPAGRMESFHDDFEHGLRAWQPLTPSSWEIQSADGRSRLVLTTAGKDRPPVRRPQEYALVKDTVWQDATVTARIKTLRPDSVKGRDVCILFGFVDDTHFYYAHLCSETNNKTHNVVMKVAGAERKMIMNEDSPEPRLTSAWHTVRVSHAADGSIKVWLDDMDRPLMTAQDTDYAAGQIGLGSFDDIAEFADVDIHGYGVTHKKVGLESANV
jgi:arylsulfatase A-like enzyme